MEIPEEAEGRYRRLVLCASDLKEARESHGRLLQLDEFDRHPVDRSPDAGAHFTRMVVAYARPYATVHGETPSPGMLPEELRADFTAEEEEMHRRLLRLRDEELAHSASAAAGIAASVVTDARTTLTAVWHRMRVPFTREEMDTIAHCLKKLGDAVQEARAEMERTLAEG